MPACPKMNPNRMNIKMLRTFKLVGTKTPEKVENLSELSNTLDFSPFPLLSTLPSLSGLAAGEVLGGPASSSVLFHQPDKYVRKFEGEGWFRFEDIGA